MAAKTISQRISLEGSEDIRKKLEQLGTAGEQAFKQIQDAAKKPITDPAQIDRTKQAIDQLVQAGTKLGQQFQALTGSAQQFGAAGAQSAQQVTTALDQTGKAAEQVGAGFQQSAVKVGAIAGAVAGVFQAAANKLISIVGQLRAELAPSALVKGVVKTSEEISDQADKIGATADQWLALRKAMTEAGVSQEDMSKALEKAGGVLDKAKGGAAQLGKGVSELSTFSNNGTVTLQRFNDTTTDLTSAASRAATELAKLGISTRAAAMPEGIARYRQLADEIRRMPEGARQAAAGVAVFGKNWKDVIDLLHTGQRDIDNTTRSMAASGKAAREMSAEQVEAGKALGKTWKDLSEAVLALKNHIGSLFVGGAQTRADWLIKLVDGSIALLKTWSQLAEAKKAAFLEGLGESPTEILFKTLLAIGQQLAGLWRDVLVPAGRQLMNIVGQISGSFEGVSKSQVIAFFTTAAIAATALAVALAGIQFVLGPLMLLFTPFGAILLAAGAAAVVFWDQIAEGAQKVAALIPNSLGLIKQAIANLFAGNFAKAWDQFKEGAVAAFQTVTQAVLQAEGPLGTFARGLVQIGQDAPAAILLVINVIKALGQAATFVANTINAIFGTELTGTGVALILIVAQLTGGLAALASAAVIVSAVIGTLIGIFGGLVTAIILGSAALVTYMGWWPQVSAAASAAMTVISQAWQGFTQIFMASLTIIANAATTAWNAIAQGAQSAWNFVVQATQSAMQFIIQAVTTPVGNAWQWIVDSFNSAMNAVIARANQVRERIKGLFTGSPEIGAPGLSDTGGFAGGGHVGGRGTGTSDSNLAWVSRGEHIMPARAVRQPGVLAFLEALRRSGGNLSRVLDGMGRFAMGGLALPQFAAGGLNGLSNVTIQFPGLQPIGGLRAPADVVEELRKAAAMAQVRSGGRKPSRYS
jgi:hypothetical protein